MKRFAAFLFVIAISVTSSEAGQIRNFVQAHGGCYDSGSAYRAITQMLDNSNYNEPKFLGKTAEDWTDEDIADFKSIYAECLRMSPIAVLGVLRTDGPNLIPPGAVEAKVEKTTARIMAGFIGPARLARRQQAAARQASIETERAEAQAQRETAQAKREAMQEQAKRDREAAELAQKDANAEAPLIEAAKKDAEEAHRLRMAAEQQLQGVRQEVATTQQKRNADNAAASTAQAERIQMEKQAREREEEEALPKSCNISVSDFAKLKPGMRVRDVRVTLGCKGSLTTGTQIEGVGTVADYRWDGVGGGFALTTFANGLLVSISQVGLD